MAYVKVQDASPPVGTDSLSKALCPIITMGPLGKMRGFELPNTFLLRARKDYDQRSFLMRCGGLGGEETHHPESESCGRVGKRRLDQTVAEP